MEFELFKRTFILLFVSTNVQKNQDVVSVGGRKVSIKPSKRLLEEAGQPCTDIVNISSSAPSPPSKLNFA